MNDTIFFSLHNLTYKSELFDKMVVFFANDFLYVVVFLAIFFLIFHRTKSFFRDGFFVVLSGGVAWGLAYIIKNLLQTPRPFLVFTDIAPLIQESGFAFPSGHTAPLAAIAFAIFILNKKIGYIFIFCALLVGVSRVVAGVHFPIDILGGFILGAIVAYVLKFANYRKSI